MTKTTTRFDKEPQKNHPLTGVAAVVA